MAMDITNPETRIFGRTVAEIDADFRRSIDDMVGDFLRQQTANFFLGEDETFFYLYNVMWGGKLCTVSWTKKQLEDGAKHPQDYWLKETKNKMEKIASAPLYDVCVEHLFMYKDVSDLVQKDLFERVKQMFNDDFNPDKTRAVTSSRIFYKAKGEDQKVQDMAKHNFGYENEESIPANIQGSDGYVNASCGFENVFEAVLKTKDCAGVEQRYEWLTGKKAYLWRLDHVASDEERAVVLGRVVDINWFDIGCVDYIGGNRPARGSVVIAEQKNSPYEMKVGK